MSPLLIVAARPFERDRAQEADVISMLLVSVLALTQTPASSASKYERNAALNNLFKDPSTADLAEVRRRLNAALSDPEDLLRTSALDIIAGFRGRQIYAAPHQNMEPWQRFVPLVLELRPRVLEALNDPVPRVRSRAVTALTTIDIETEPGLPARVPPALAQVLQHQFVEDESAGVRGIVVNFFANTGVRHDPATLAIAKEVLMKGLVDPDPYVVQFAGRAMYERKYPDALPLLVKQLTNPSHVARMGVSAGLQGYGTAARPYLPQMEEALAREPEGPTRKTLEATITRIREGSQSSFALTAPCGGSTAITVVPLVDQRGR